MFNKRKFHELVVSLLGIEKTLLTVTDHVVIPKTEVVTIVRLRDDILTDLRKKVHGALNLKAHR